MLRNSPPRFVRRCGWRRGRPLLRQRPIYLRKALRAWTNKRPVDRGSLAGFDRRPTGSLAHPRAMPDSGASRPLATMSHDAMDGAWPSRPANDATASSPREGSSCWKHLVLPLFPFERRQAPHRPSRGAGPSLGGNGNAILMS
jgi:hypothetical protein